MRIPVSLIQVAICIVILLHIRISSKSFNASDTPQMLTKPVDSINKGAVKSSRQVPLVLTCNKNYKVAFTFDDGPHPTYTPLIVDILNQNRVNAGFFLLGTSIQSFLGAHNNLSVHQFERPRIGYLLLQDYSLIEELYKEHDIYLHGWLHEKINEMRLQTVIDNISTQLVEIGLLKRFKPVYRAPWGIGTAPATVNNKALLAQILNQMGIISAHWNIDSKDYLVQVNGYNLTKHILQMICKQKGGLILMHDNRPTTAKFLDQIIRSIRASGHIIINPDQINRQWNNQTLTNRTRKYTELLRQRIQRIQGSLANIQSNIFFRPVEVSLPNTNRQSNLIQSIDPNARYRGKIKVTPNINDVDLNPNSVKSFVNSAKKRK